MNKLDPDVIARIRDFISGLRLGAEFECHTSREGSLTKFSVLPRQDKFCGFTLEAGNNEVGSYGFYCDPDCSFDELDAGVFDPVDLVKAITDGHVRFFEYRFWGWLIKVVVVIILGNKKELRHTRHYWLPLPQHLCSRMEFKYSPYPS